MHPFGSCRAPWRHSGDTEKERETTSSFITVNLIETSGAARKGAESVPRSNRDRNAPRGLLLSVFLSVSSLPLLFFSYFSFFSTFSPLSSYFLSFLFFSFFPPLPLPISILFFSFRRRSRSISNYDKRHRGYN